MTSTQDAAGSELMVDVPAGLLADTVTATNKLNSAGTPAAQADALTKLHDLMSQLMTWHPHFDSEMGEILDEDELAERGVPEHPTVDLDDAVAVPADLFAATVWMFALVEGAPTAINAAYSLIRLDELIGDLSTYHPAYDLDRGEILVGDED